MSNLYGLKPYLLSNNDKEGDIAIKIIGLRPGEKLYEELLYLITHKDRTSKNMGLHEKCLSEKVVVLLEKLKTAIKDYDLNKIQSLLEFYLEDFKKSKIVNDHFTKSKSNKIYKLYK